MNAINALLSRLEQGRLHDPFQLLGRHQVAKGWEIRAWLPTASSVLLEGEYAMQRVGNSALFIVTLTEAQHKKMPLHYQLEWQEGDYTHSMVSPDSFSPLLGELDLHLFAEGQHWQIYEHLGAHLKT